MWSLCILSQCNNGTYTAVTLVRKPRGGRKRLQLAMESVETDFYCFLITKYVNVTPPVARVMRERFDSLDASVHMSIRTGAEFAWTTRKTLNRLRT